MTHPRFYSARGGLIWTLVNDSVRTIAEAEGALEQLGQMAVETKSPTLSGNYLVQHADLVAAIREARAQVANSGDADLSRGEAA